MPTMPHHTKKSSSHKISPLQWIDRNEFKPVSALAFLRFAFVQIKPSDVTLVFLANVADDASVEHGRNEVGVVFRAVSTASNDL